MSKTLAIGVALMGALVLAGLAGARPTTFATERAVPTAVPSSTIWTLVRKCSGVTAKLGGKRVCVAAGRTCQSRFERTYERLGFVCRAETLYRKVVVPNAQILATIPVGAAPNAIRYLDGSIWVKDFLDGTLSRIDPATNAVTATIQVGGGVGDIAYGDGSIWVVSEEPATVSRIDPATNAVIATIPTQGIRPMGIAWTPGAVWVAHHGHNPGEQPTVVRIDTATNRVVWQTGVGDATFNAVGGPSWMTAAFGAVWFVGNELERIDPGDNSITSSSSIDCAAAATAFAGSLWLPGCSSNVVYRFDPATNTIVGRIAGPTGAQDISPLAVDGAYLWATTDTPVLEKIDPIANKVVATWHQPAQGLFQGPAAIAYGEGSIWVADSPGNRVLRLKP